MVNIKKKYIILALGVISLVSIVFIIAKIRQSKVTESITPPKPDIPSYITGALPIEILVKKQDFDFPKTLPTLSISKRNLDKNTVSQFSEKLGFGTSLSEFQDISEGIKYFAGTDKHFFVATPKTSVVKYGINTSEIPSVVSKNISDEELVSLATKFLTENGFYKDEQIKALPPVYLKSNPSSEGLEKTDRNSAQVFQIAFVFKSTEFEILAQYSPSPQIFLQVLPNGEIFNSEILLIENLERGITDYPLKTYEDLTENLSEARLIALSGDYISPSDLKIEDITSLKVESIRLAYLQESGKDEFLQPIFLLEGPASVQGSTVNSATIYMPAFK